MKRIMLACNAGMSTSILVKKMQGEARSRGLDVDVSALPLSSALEKARGVDILMLGPQVSYAKDEAQQAAGDVPVVVIGMMEYGRMDAGKVLDEALDVIGRD